MSDNSIPIIVEATVLFELLMACCESLEEGDEEAVCRVSVETLQDVRIIVSDHPEPEVVAETLAIIDVILEGVGDGNTFEAPSGDVVLCDNTVTSVDPSPSTDTGPAAAT